MINILMDLVGKEFTSVKFVDKRLTWGGAYTATIGKVGKIIGLHLDCPEYVCVEFTDIKWEFPLRLHWHIDIVTEQILNNERIINPNYIDILYKEIFKAIKQICQNKK